MQRIQDFRQPTKNHSASRYFLMTTFSLFTCRGDLTGVASAYVYASFCYQEEQPKIFDATLSPPGSLFTPTGDLQLRNGSLKAKKAFLLGMRQKKSQEKRTASSHSTRHIHPGWLGNLAKKRITKCWGGDGEPREAVPEATAAPGSFRGEYGWDNGGKKDEREEGCGTGNAERAHNSYDTA